MLGVLTRGGKCQGSHSGKNYSLWTIAQGSACLGSCRLEESGRGPIGDLNHCCAFLPQDGVGGIMVSIAAFQAVDPGSIPGRRSVLFVELGAVMRASCAKKRELTPT